MAYTILSVSPVSYGNVPLGTGWILVTLSTVSPAAFNPGENIIFNYAAYPPLGPQGRGFQGFDLREQGGAGGLLITISTPPVVSLGPGTTSYFSFTILVLSRSARCRIRRQCNSYLPICAQSQGDPSLSTATLSAGYYSAGGLYLILLPGFLPRGRRDFNRDIFTGRQPVFFFLLPDLSSRRLF